MTKKDNLSTYREKAKERLNACNTNDHSIQDLWEILKHMYIDEKWESRMER